MRSDEAAPEQLVTELLLALSTVHIISGRGRSPGEVWITDPGRPLPVVGAPAPTTGAVRTLVGAHEDGFLVADRLAAPQRAVLDGAGWGWWDRRGSLRVSTRAGTIDVAPPALPSIEAERAAPFARASSRTVGLELLRTGEAGRSVRRLAAACGLSVGAAGRAVAELRTAGLLSEPLDRAALFDELAASWRPRWYGLRAAAGPTGDPLLDQVLRTGTSLREASGPGWAVVSRHAAVAYGAMVPVPDEPLRLLVPDDRSVAWAVHRWGTQADGPIEVAVAPTPGAVLARRPWGAAEGVPWRLADPVVVALTLTTSPDRTDREAADALRRVVGLTPPGPAGAPDAPVSPSTGRGGA